MSRKVLWSLSLIVIVTLMLTACGGASHPRTQSRADQGRRAAAAAPTAAPAAKAEPTKAP